MTVTLDLAEAHRIDQVRSSVATQAALAAAFDKYLDPKALDATFPDYLRAALSVIAYGRDQSASMALFYYGSAKTAAGYEGLSPSVQRELRALGVVDPTSATISLAVNGPVSIKKQLANGTALEAAVRGAQAKTLSYGKRAHLNASRAVLIGAVKADTDALGWARVSDGQPCPFCGMLVSRGPVYKRETANFRAHDGCGCGVRPWFEGDEDAGWSPDAKALRELWDADLTDDLGRPISWRERYLTAVQDPGSDVFRTFTDKISGQVAVDVARQARKAARTAFSKAQDAQRAAEAAARAALTKEAREAAEKEAKEAAKQAALTKKWLGKPAPVKPTPPAPPATVGAAAFDEFLEGAKKRFADFAAKTGNPKNDLTQSLNWSYFQRIVNDHDRSAIDYLKAQSYLDDDLALKAHQAIDRAQLPLPGAEEAYKKALRSYRNRLTRYERYREEWRGVNGITGAELRGMDDALRHASDADGIRWADANLKVATGTSRTAIKSYTGSDYSPWNGALRRHQDAKALPPGWEEATKKADAGFAPVPESVIVHRGTNWNEFDLGDGKREHSIPPPPPSSLIGSIQVQYGYMSTSVGNTAAFSSNPVQMKILLPEGHKASWAMPYSRFTSERELLLERGTRYFVHDVYQENGRWIMECEILPMDADEVEYLGAATRPSSTRWTR